MFLAFWETFFSQKLVKNLSKTCQKLCNDQFRKRSCVFDVPFFYHFDEKLLVKKGWFVRPPQQWTASTIFKSPLLLSTTQENQVEIFVAHHMEWQDIIHKMQPCRKNAVPPLLHSYLLRAETVSGFQISGQSMKCLFKPQMSIQFVHFSFSYCQSLWKL